MSLNPQCLSYLHQPQHNIVPVKKVSFSEAPFLVQPYRCINFNKLLQHILRSECSPSRYRICLIMSKKSFTFEL